MTGKEQKELRKKEILMKALEPFVFQRFILMEQAVRVGMPEEIRKAADDVSMIEFSAKVIKKGQKTGAFKAGDAMMLSECFWSSVQGVMEQMATDSEFTPNPDWFVSIMKK